MKIRTATHNSRKKTFEIRTSTKRLAFPFSKADPAPSLADPVKETFVDAEAGREAFTYVLASGRTGTVHVEQVLEYNQDPSYSRDLLLYRLLDQTNYRKSVDQLLALLQVLDCEIDLVVRTKTA